MAKTQQPTLYTKDLKPLNQLTKPRLADLVHLEREALAASRKQAPAKKPTVQMSVRMGEDEYIRFRALCRALRKTNGDMVAQLVDVFLDKGR